MRQMASVQKSLDMAASRRMSVFFWSASREVSHVTPSMAKVVAAMEAIL